MIIFSGNFNGISSSPSNKSYKVNFIADETQREGILKIANNLKFGSEVLIMVFDVSSEQKDISELASETPEETKKRFMKQMYSTIRKLAEYLGKGEEEVKFELKEFLKEQKLIKESSSELTVQGLAIAINYLYKKLN
jgi:hypothetical protein